MKASSLKELQQLQQRLVEQQKLDALKEEACRQAQRKLDAEKNLFVRAAGAVQPIRDPRRVPLAPARPLPVAVQQKRDDQSVLRESISDQFDTGTLLEVDDALSYRRVGIGADVTRKLRRGDWSIQREIDLHGLRREDARDALAAFVREVHRQGLRCVRVVHGKGLGSPGKTPVLKGMVHNWLIQKDEVLAFVQARRDEGGAGALVVLLKPSSGAP